VYFRGLRVCALGATAWVFDSLYAWIESWAVLNILQHNMRSDEAVCILHDTGLLFAVAQEGAPSVGSS
jgi:hypothetical protein